MAFPQIKIKKHRHLFLAMSLALLFSIAANAQDHSRSRSEDIIYAEQSLREAGFELTPLSQNFLYRGDQRSPEIIFQEGFKRIETPGTPPFIEEYGQSRGLIATTTTFLIAVGFADVPSLEWGETLESHSWVYLLKAPVGIDVRSDSNRTMAQDANEITLIEVPADQVIAAIKIQKTRENGIYSYILKN